MKTKFKKFLSPRNFIITFIVSVLLHNLIYALTNIEEPFFFLLAIFSFFGFILSLLHKLFITACKFLKKK